jgi:predicted kinase
VGAADARPDVVDRDELRSARAAGSLDGRLERLPDSHPASPRYCADGHGAEDAGEWRDAGDADERVRPLTDAEHAEHVAEVRVRLEAARAAGLASDVQHTVDGWGEIWSDERQAAHDALVGDLYSAAEHVPRDRRVIMAGGLPGSGKTTVLHEHAGIDLSQYLMINPDVIKEEMASRGLMPEIEGLSPMEASDLVHEESSYIAKRLANRAEADGRNVVWDITMSRTESANERIDELEAAGYAHIEAVFVDIPIDVSLRRADSRHREGHDAYCAGQGFGGRLVPRETILRLGDEEWGSRNRANFEELKPRFQVSRLFDNSVDGRAAVLLESCETDDNADEGSWR